jgi:hypothetical protein
MNKKKKFLLLWFWENEVKNYTFMYNTVRHSCLSINCYENWLRLYQQILTQLHLVDWVFFDDIIKVIHKIIKYDKNNITSPMSMIDRINSLLDNNKDIIVLYRINNNSELDYLYSRIKNKIEINSVEWLKQYIK